MTITKSRDDSCSSFLRAKLIRKEKRSAISSQFMNPSRIYQQTAFLSNLMNPFRTSLSLLSYKIPSKKRCCHFFQRKTKTNHQPIKPMVPPKYWTFFAKSYHANDRNNNMSKKKKKKKKIWTTTYCYLTTNLVVHQFVKTTKAHYRTMLKVSQNGNTIQHLSFLPSKKNKAKTYHGQYEKYTSILTLRMQHSSRSVYLEWTQLFIFP